MNYSCCYVLTDNKDLHYFNQMMISLSSLRYTGFPGTVYVVTDNETACLINPRRNELNDLSAEIVVVGIEESYTNTEKSRFLKSSLRKYIQGNVLYVDTDTVFASCPPEWISDDDIAMAYNLNGLNDNRSYQWHKVYFDQCGLDCREDDIFFNSGVIWMRDTEAAHGLFDKWHSFWKELLRKSGIPNDQVSLNYLWNHNEITVSRLDDQFNVQIGRQHFSPLTLSNAILIHYFGGSESEPIFSLRDLSIQMLDYRDERIQQIIQDPLSAFSDCRWMKKDGLTDEYLKTESFRIWFYIFRKHRRLFSIFEGFCKVLLKIRKSGGKNR